MALLLFPPQNPDGRRIQINLTGFLNGKNARVFTGELWDLLLDAMENSGVPSVILNAKKVEISQRFQQQEQLNNQSSGSGGGGNDKSSIKNSRSEPQLKSSSHDDRKTQSRYQDKQDYQSHSKHSYQPSHRSQVFYFQVTSTFYFYYE